MARQSDAFQTATAGVPVLITRPEAEARAFAGALSARFGARTLPLIAPLMSPDYLSPPLPAGPFTGVIFTSVHGVKAARDLCLRIPGPAFCVGKRTAMAAREAGFEAVSADGDAEALLLNILASRPTGRILHVRGEETRGDLEFRLNTAGVRTSSLVAYRMLPLPLQEEAAQRLRRGGKVIVTLFSPRSALLFSEALPPSFKASLHLAVISASVSAAVSRLAAAAVQVAVTPDAAGMVDAVADLLGQDPAP